jgi:hypothetical protein
LLAFFPWRKAPKVYRAIGHVAVVVVTTTSFLITEDTIVYCIDRFMHQDISFIGLVKQFDKMVVSFYDPD